MLAAVAAFNRRKRVLKGGRQMTTHASASAAGAAGANVTPVALDRPYRASGGSGGGVRPAEDPRTRAFVDA